MAAVVLDAAALLDVLERTLHASSAEWLFLRELRVGTGHRNQAAQRLDAFALNCLPHKAMLRVCYEVKTSRADLLSELRQPLKRRIGLRYSNEFYFVTPCGLLDLSELPVECGLVEIGCERVPTALVPEAAETFPHYDSELHAWCTIRVPAPWRDTPGPTWQFAAAMLRNQRRSLEPSSAIPAKQLRISFTPSVKEPSETSG
jgi:hypothetical protein